MLQGTPDTCHASSGVHIAMTEKKDITAWARDLTWSAQINDLVGGWIVTDHPHPLSEHDHRPNGDHFQCGYVVAECMVEMDAKRIAALLNAYGPIPYQLRQRVKEGPLRLMVPYDVGSSPAHEGGLCG